LPPELVELLVEHRAEQDHERAIAAQLWTDGGWVFATAVGGPLNPRTDWTDWKKLLIAAGVRDGRLHDARHTAATVFPARCSRAGGHARHGVVEHGHGGALPARHGHEQA
jgi:integrase